MSLSPEMKRVALTATGAAFIALIVAHIGQSVEQVVKRGLVDNPERVGKPVKSDNESATLNQAEEDEFTYDFIIIGGGLFPQL
jgi:hypothetical protein